MAIKKQSTRGGKRPGAGRPKGSKDRNRQGPRNISKPGWTHGLYSRILPDGWQDSYDYYKSDPEYTSLRAEIALAQSNLDQFLDRCKGKLWTDKRQGWLSRHLEHVANLKEREGRRIYQARVVEELIVKQVEQEAASLREILLRRFDADTAEAICAEFAARLAEAAGPRASVNL